MNCTSIAEAPGLRSRGERQLRPGLVLANAVLAAELVYTSARIDNLLLARIKRVARGAHFNPEILAERRTRREFVATTTGDLDGVVTGMNVGFHDGSPERACT